MSCVEQIQVWDTAGQERFRTITQSYYRSAHGAMITYDITRRATFDSVAGWIHEVELYGAANVVLVLIGGCDDAGDVGACMQQCLFSVDKITETLQNSQQQACLGVQLVFSSSLLAINDHFYSSNS